MLTKKSVSLSCLTLLSAASLSACVIAPPPRHPPRPREPEPMVEVVPAAPAPGYHWVKGHNRWEGDHWVWVRGHWAPY